MSLNPSNPSLEVDFVVAPAAPGGDGGFETNINSLFIQETIRNLIATNLSKGTLTKEQSAELLKLLTPKLLPPLPGIDPSVEGEWKTKLEVIISLNNMLPSYFFSKGMQASRAVCKIQTSGVAYNGVSGTWSGTGFLIGKNLLMTNHHVLNSKTVASRASIIFDYERENENSIKDSAVFKLDPNSVFITSPPKEFDFTIVAVKGNPGEKYGYVTLNRNPLNAIDGLLANIIHHPQGNYKSISIQDNQVVFTNEALIHYLTDTEEGSSGAPIFDNNWNAIGIHHAAKEREESPKTYINEGIKFSAIAAHLEKIKELAPLVKAEEALKSFSGSDPLLGYFGALGREQDMELSGLERLVYAYMGDEKDIDIGFWNIEWFNTRYQDKLEQVAEVIYNMKLDVWALVEVSPQSTQVLVNYLKEIYQLDFGFAASEPDASQGRQTTTVIWNKKTVNCERIEWSDSVKNWFTLQSKNFKDDMLEAVHGKIFDRYPGLFKVSNILSPESEFQPFSFYLVPVHLKAMSEGSLRREMASKILAAATNKMIKEGHSKDWIIGGDYNAELASKNFNPLLNTNFVAISAQDEAKGEISYLGDRFASLIDHIFLSENMSRQIDQDDFYIVAKDREIPNYVKNISDHRPILVRLSLKKQVEAEIPEETDDELQDIINSLGNAQEEDSPNELKTTLLAIAQQLQEIINKLNNTV